MRTTILRVNDNVLLVGEGNFSFGVSLMKLNLNINITATCYESSIVFESGLKNADYLKLKGARVILGVDATKLTEHYSMDSEEFDKIIFNFPHVGGKMKIDRNRELLKGFFISSQTLLKPKGVVLVSLCNGQGGTPMDNPQRRWDDSWQIVEMAAHGNFLLTGVEPFSFAELPDYTCVGYRSLEKGFDNKNSLVHILQKADQPNLIKIAPRIRIDPSFKNNLELEDIISWKQLIAEFADKDVSEKSDILSLYPLSYSFHITFSVCSDFTEITFYMTLFKFVGKIIDNVEFLGSYEFPNSSKVTRTYNISYRSTCYPLYRSRVIDIHKNIVTNILEDHLNVVVTK